MNERDKLIKSVKVFAPASVANVACGFDVFGFAVSALGDTVELRLHEGDEIEITEILGDGGRLPKDPRKNTASVALLGLCQALQKPAGFQMRIHKGMPLGSGMGSSAASAVAALVAANELFGTALSRQELLPFAMQAEAVACGSPHADNVAPSMLGGFVLVRSSSPLDVLSLPMPEDLFVVLLHPNIEIRTEDARKLLRSDISLSAARSQWANTAGLVAALYTSDYGLLARCLEDHIAEPKRSVLIPGFPKFRAAAIHAGALGLNISGSGPSLFSLCKGKACAEHVSQALEDVCTEIGLGYHVYTAPLPSPGPCIIQSEE